MKNTSNNVVIYQAKNGSIEFRGDFDKNTIWGTQKQIANIFNVNPQAITKHIKNIYSESELNENSTCSKMEQVRVEGVKKVKRKLNFYNLDMIISIGYRVNSKQATQFRIWSTKILKQHLLDGYTFNKKRISQNYEQFIKAISNIKTLLPASNKIEATDVLDLVNIFASTWVSLEAYDKDDLPKIGLSKNGVSLTVSELSESILALKKELINKKQATDVFGMERNKNSIDGIIGSVFQSAFGKDVYSTVEEKASHLLYFIIKNHPFVDGNKRSGAFAFIWFLSKAGILSMTLTPEALTTLTLLIASSSPNDRDKMIGLVLLLLKKPIIDS
ncbi:virulence protein RhuM/Fic/DOC family protein [Patescibacteria group bacterium]|nr:virulence protein RhuM/Fic/DOC family protein [Patescibacteria group bacterium]